MKSGSHSQLSHFNRGARQCMFVEEQLRWDALDRVLGGNALPQHLFLAEEARKSVLDIPALKVANILEHHDFRRETQQEAQRFRNRLLGRIRAAMRSGNMARLERTVDAYFCSIEAKVCAYEDVWSAVTHRDLQRMPIESLYEYAGWLSPYKLSCAIARGRLVLKNGVSSPSNDPADYRAIVTPSIHHHAMHQLVLHVLEIFFPELRSDQYAQTGHGSIAAVEAAITKMSEDNIQFVAECDIENFYASIGERGGLPSTNRLHEQLFMLPKAVVESSVLASGMLVELPGGANLTNRQKHPLGVPQGSVVSSFLGEHIVRQIMTEAEGLARNGQEMIALGENITIFGDTTDDVESLLEPLTLSAKTNPYGDFKLRQSQSIRHKSAGILVKGHRIQWRGAGYVNVAVSEDNVQKFQQTLARKLKACRFSSQVQLPEREEAVANIEEVICRWIANFKLVPGITEQARELFVEVLREEPPATEELFGDFLTRWRDR